MPLGKLDISLVIPIKNESDSIIQLLESISKQTFQPKEIILVDGGSTDNTVELIRKATKDNHRIKLLTVSQATPGKGRNIGIEKAESQWVALTDAGICLDKDWLKNLAIAADSSNCPDIVYGNFSPIISSNFEKCAAISYVPALRENSVRSNSVASMLLKKKVWEQVEGFPDLRAAEDLMFMEKAQKLGFIADQATNAQVFWQLRPNLTSTFQKFTLYSKHNVLAGRAWDWHYGIVKQYLVVLPFLFLAIFHTPYWGLGVLLWLMARTGKRIFSHRYEFGITTLLNPVTFIGVMILIITIDTATFRGWLQAYFNRSTLEQV